jgi:hypothetical protein
VSLLPPDTEVAHRDAHRGAAAALLPLARIELDSLPDVADPLAWWPRQLHLGSLFNLAKMYFATPVSSADNERAFSSAGFTMGWRRGRLEMETFRMEHRIRRFLTAGGADSLSQLGRELRHRRARELLEHFAELVAQRAAAAGAEDDPQ